MSKKLKKNISDPIIKQLSETLKKELGKSIKDIILFGSRTRGDSCSTLVQATSLNQNVLKRYKNSTFTYNL